MDKNTKYFLILFFGIPLVYFIYTSISFHKNEILIKGRFHKKVYWPKSGTNYVASFEYKGYTYEASCKIMGDCVNNNFEFKAINREVYILIDSTNPKTSVILTVSSEYQKYNLTYPTYLDSLLNCKY